MEALLYQPLSGRQVQCHLCCHRCVIADGRRGLCGVRENRGGLLNTLVYGRLVARHSDPIEKKPLFHFFPGHRSYSIATVGCNFKCLFCQNADIAQMPADRSGMIIGETFTPDQVVAAAVAGGCRSIAYTYTEPTVFFEFALETAQRAHAQGLLNVFVTNGYMTPEALAMAAPYLDAANVDLKAFTGRFYQKFCGARLAHVQETLKGMRARGVLVEVTTLLIPGENDNPAELESLARFLVKDLGAETPWHISRFHPTYRLREHPVTPLKKLLEAREIGLRAGLRHVYTGNVPGHDTEKTYCHQCQALLIDRWGFEVKNNRIREGRCPACGARIAGVGL